MIMNTLISSLVTLAVSAAAVGLVSLLISCLFKYAKVFVHRGAQRIHVGYLIPNSQDQLVFYNGLFPLFRRRKGVVDNSNDIKLEQRNASHNYIEKPQPVGRYDKPSRLVYNASGSLVASIVDGRCRTKYAVDNDIYVASAKGSIASRGQVAPYGAALAALLGTESQKYKNAPDERVGAGDLVLPAAFIFFVAYYGLVQLFGDMQYRYFALAMFATYLLILFILYLIKYSITIGNGTMRWPVLIDENAGMRWVDILLILLAVVLIIVAPHQWVPALTVLIIALVINSINFENQRTIEDPYQGWSGHWRRQPFSPAPSNAPNALNMRSITFSWKEILEKRNVPYDASADNVTIQLPSTYFEGNNPLTRFENPFFQPGLQDESQREAFTNKVLDGVDKTLRAKGTTDVFEDLVLSQIVNSAYEVCVRHNLADFEMFDLILSFCQMNINYKVDEECDSINNIREYYRFASETLYDRTGDCDCKAVLAYKLFELLGVDPRFVIVKANNEDVYNHAAIVLRNDPDARIPLPPQYKEYAPGKGVYCEATSDGRFHPGDMPDNVDFGSIRFVNRTA